MKKRGAPTVRYQMRAKIASIGDDSWIEDDQGHKTFKVNGKAMRLRDTFVLEDMDGNEVAKIQERKLHVRDTMAIERGGQKIATVDRRLVGLRDHLKVEIEGGPDMKVHGNLVDHEYEIEGEPGRSARSRRSGSGYVTPTVSRSEPIRMFHLSWRSPSRSMS